MTEIEIIQKLEGLAYGRKLTALAIINKTLYATFENEDDNPDDVRIGKFLNGDLMELLRDAMNIGGTK